jgi:arylsulfatase A-like enzyme
MATCVDVSGGEYPRTYNGNQIQPAEGISLAATFAGQALRERAIYWEHEGNRAVRLGKWKLVSKYPGGWELYDMEHDRTEMHNLASEHPEKVDELKSLWERWAKRAGVQPWPLKSS